MTTQQANQIKVAVFGATGNVGSAIVDEGRARGHQVTTVSSREGAADLAANVTDLDAVRRIAGDVDAVVISVPPPRNGDDHGPWLEAHRRLATTELPARLAMVGGAGSTEIAGKRLVDSPDFPEAFAAEARTVAQALDAFRAAQSGPDWVVLSPAPMIAPGERTGNYRLGLDEVVGDQISTQDYAVALWDELERPAHRRQRFIAAN